MTAAHNDFTDDEYEIKLLLSNRQFEKDVLALRQKWQVPLDGIASNKALNNWNENISDEAQNELQEDIYLLINKFSLSERWANGLKHYLLSNDATILRATPYTEWRFEYKGDTANPEDIQAVWIKVDADTTQREIAKALKHAKTMLPAKPKRQAYTYLNHALRAKELKHSGAKWSKVTALINEEFGTSYEENYVIKMVSRLNKHL